MRIDDLKVAIDHGAMAKHQDLFLLSISGTLEVNSMALNGVSGICPR